MADRAKECGYNELYFVYRDYCSMVHPNPTGMTEYFKDFSSGFHIDSGPNLPGNRLILGIAASCHIDILEMMNKDFQLGRRDIIKNLRKKKNKIFFKNP